MTLWCPERPERSKAIEELDRGLNGGGATACYVGVWGLALLVPWPAGKDGDSAVAAVLVLTSSLVYLIVLVTAVGYMIAARREKHSGGQLPPRRAQGGRALEGGRNHGPGDDPILCRARSGARARGLTVLPAHAPSDPPDSAQVLTRPGGTGEMRRRPWRAGTLTAHARPRPAAY
jgi:hypothetical protein